MNFVLTIILLLIALPAMATGTPDPKDPVLEQEQAQSQAQGQAQQQAQAQGQVQEQVQQATANSEASSSASSESGSSANNSLTVTGVRQHRNAPDVALGGLFPSAVCLGVGNAGVSGPGFGIGGGKSYRDEECDKRETARSFAALGYRDEALVILCSTEAARALARCPFEWAKVEPVVCPECTARRDEKVIEQKKQVESNSK